MARGPEPPGPGVPASDPSPFRPEHFRVLDSAPDSHFYRQPRLVAHIDAAAIGALRTHYARILPPDGAVLDLMSSWISHFPAGYRPRRAAGVGLNAEELAANPALTERLVQDLNEQPRLPYESASFDAVVMAVSVQYLRQPLATFAEIARVLRPQGICAVSFSNRCFPTKAVAIWQVGDDALHARLVAAYFHYAGGFTAAEALDLSPDPGRSDPLYVMQARRQAP